MAEEIPQSHIKLATTVTAGAGGEHSPYYRRLLSAGYKGFIQGTIGGATLYGLFGAAIGGIIGLATIPLWGPTALLAVPILGAAGLMKGAETFGRIGSTAAIYAEGAEMNERRRALIDRLQETDSQKEADEIINLLQQESKEKPPEKIFHWKSVIVGALLGAATIALILAFPAGAEAMHFAMAPLAELMGVTGIEVAGSHAIAAVAPVLIGIGSAIGALAGATIGIDRYYIRKWFDISEDTVHDPEKSRTAAIERQREATRLHEISKTDKPQQGITTNAVAPQAGNNTHSIIRYESDDQAKPRVKVDATAAAPQTERLKSAEEALKIQL